MPHGGTLIVMPPTLIDQWCVGCLAGWLAGWLAGCDSRGWAKWASPARMRVGSRALLSLL